MNTTTLVLILFVMFIVPWVVRAIWPHKITWIEMLASFLISGGFVTILYIAGVYSQTHNVEILNGEVTSKERIHDTYLQSYKCNCRTTRSGKTNTTTCSTCYRRHYTVSWDCHTNLGNITIDKKDWTNQGVYLLPDPDRYTIIKTGDPVAQEHSYTNYVKAAPDSLFHQIDVKKHEKLIPIYPDKVYDYYKINRVLTMGVSLPDQDTWNYELSLMLKTLGPQKQANVVIVFVNTADQSYLHSLEGKWIGGNKNDIIVIIGTSNYPKIDWVGVSSWTDSQLFKVELRDSIIALGSVERRSILNLIEQKTLQLYVRKEMKDFQYLQNQVEPPTWVIVLDLILGICLLIGTSWYFYKHDPFKEW